MYLKAESVDVTSHAHPTGDSGDSSPSASEERGKLKSVVQVVIQETTDCEVKLGDASTEDIETVGGATDGNGAEGENGET